MNGHESLPLETPICYKCRRDALSCKCGLTGGKELVTLTAEPAPSSKEAGIHRWVSFICKHAHVREFQAVGFATTMLDMGFLAALVKEEKTLIKMAMDYAERAFISLPAAKMAHWEFSSPEAAEQELLHHRQHLAPAAVQLFLSCNWSTMNLAQANLMFEAINSYHAGEKIKKSLQLMWDAIVMVRNVYYGVSSDQSYCFEVLQHLAPKPLSTPSKVSQEGLNLKQFEQLMTYLVKTENNDLRWLLAVSLQVNAVLEEILSWRASFMNTEHVPKDRITKLELLRMPSRFCGLMRQPILRLNNPKICPIVVWDILDQKGLVDAGKYTDPRRFKRLLQSNQLAMAFFVHDKGKRDKSKLASLVKKEIADALAAALGITMQPFEAQPFLDACRRNYRVQTWDAQDEHRMCAYCGLRGSMMCSACHQLAYCSKQCQRRDWKKHKLICNQTP